MSWPVIFIQVYLVIGLIVVIDEWPDVANDVRHLPLLRHRAVLALFVVLWLALSVPLWPWQVPCWIRDRWHRRSETG